MERPFPLPAHGTADGGYVVRGTEPGDIVTGALTAAYRREKAMPDDLAKLLALLNRVPD